MTTATIPDWTARILVLGKLGTSHLSGWMIEAYEQYRAKVPTPEYPCFFGQAAEARGEMLYCFSAKVECPA